MEQNVQRIGITNWITLLLTGVTSVAVSQYASSAGGQVGTTFLGLGFLVALVSYFQMRLEERERAEELEFRELRQAKADSTLFAENAADVFPARRSRQQFERFMVPAFTVVMLAAQGVAAWWFWRRLATAAPASVERAAVAMSLNALCALVLFLLGKYSAGLGRLEFGRLLRPAAGYMMLGSVVCFLTAAAEAAVFFGWNAGDLWLARAFCVVLALAAVETLVTLVFELYRPRVKQQAARVLYESRLIGLLGQPGGLVSTAAHALDYQFGFKISETWAYRFLQEKLPLLVLVQLAVLWLSSCLVIIEPNEQGLHERFGRPVARQPVIGPGPHLKWPWPVDRIFRYRTGEVRSFVVGSQLDEERTMVWTRPHYKAAEAGGGESYVLVASQGSGMRAEGQGEQTVAANLLSVSIPVHYIITNLTSWVYGHADARRFLEATANSEVIRYLVSTDFERVMGVDRARAGEDLLRNIQRQADEARLGVKILFVGLQDIHPPLGNKMTQVAAAFEQVVGARQRLQTTILEAEAYQARTVPLAHAEATNLVAEAQGERLFKLATAAAESSTFTNQMAAYAASPKVYLQRTYLDALGRSIGSVRKYVLAPTNTQDVVVLNFEERIRADLLSGVVVPNDARKPATPARATP